MIRIVIADDHELIRGGLAGMLGAQDDLEVVGEAGDGAAAVDLVLRERPDVVVMDIRMPGMDGIAATRRLAEHGLAAGVLVLVLVVGGLVLLVRMLLRKISPSRSERP